MKGYIVGIQTTDINLPSNKTRDIFLKIEDGVYSDIHMGTVKIIQNETDYDCWVAKIEDSDITVGNQWRDKGVLVTLFFSYEEHEDKPEFIIGECEVSFYGKQPINLIWGNHLKEN